MRIRIKRVVHPTPYSEIEKIEEIEVGDVFIDSLSAAIAKKIFAAPAPRLTDRRRPLHYSLDGDQPIS